MQITSCSVRVFSDNERANRDTWTTNRIENDCEGCEILADGETWRPAEHCPVHGVNYETFWRDLNEQLDARWPGRWTP